MTSPLLRQKLLGPSGLRVSELCLGTLTFGEAKKWGADAVETAAMLGLFTDAGGTFIDTAPNYGAGAAEELVGAFVADRRDDYVVATKYTASANAHPLAGGNGRKSMMRSVEASLRRLRTDHIDLLWLHYWDGTTPLEEIVRAMDDLVRAGKILHIGFSDTPAWLTSRAATLAQLRGWAPVVATQIEYSLAARSSERELLPMAEALGLGVVGWGPLAAGALVGGGEPRRRPQSTLPEPLPHAAAELHRISLATGLSSVALALRWVMRRGVIPIVGARTSEQLGATLSQVGESLDDTTDTELTAIAPVELGFPYDLIASPYLRRLALGDPDRFDLPPPRA